VSTSVKNSRFGSESLRSDALAMHGHGSTPRYLKSFAHLAPGVLPAGAIATARYVAPRKGGTASNLALFGNFAYAELRP
jgi:hypothetical protein